MDNNDIKRHIEKRENELKLHRLSWEYFEKLHLDVGLSDNVYNELKEKISSKIVQCERSIIDHKKLIKAEK